MSSSRWVEMMSAQYFFRILAGRILLSNYHVVVRAAGPHQLFMRPALGDAAIFHEQDEIGAAHRREAMRDHESRAAGKQRRHRRLDQLLALRVQVARGL